MGGSIEYDGGGESLSRPAMPTLVCRYIDDDTRASGGSPGDPDDPDMTLVPLPNLQWEQISARVGAEPAVAQLRYALDDAAVAQGFPARWEQIWPIDATSPYILKPDDRIVILGRRPDGSLDLLFDGHAQVPTVSVGPATQDVRITAVDVASRCWDTPIGGRIERNADQAETDYDGVQTDLPTRFNPTDARGVLQQNSVPFYTEVNHSDAKKAYPIFLDPTAKMDSDPNRTWTLSGAVRYLLAVHNDEKWVTNPDFSDLDALLKARKPLEGKETYDPSDPATYDDYEIEIRDYDATNKAWPEAVADLLEASGFGMRFLWGIKDDLPVHQLDIFRYDDMNRSPKQVWMGAAKSDVSPARNTAFAISLARDLNGVANTFAIETRPRRVEISVVLACGYTPNAADAASATARQAFLKSKLQGANVTTTALRKYRWYVADEAGEGHFDPTAGAWVTGQFLELAAVFPPKDKKGTPSYVRRFRPGLAELNSRDASGRPLRAVLHWSQDYTGSVASLWDGTGTWAALPGGWELLDDRLGIRCTLEDPEQWGTGAGKPDLHGITWQANPPTGKRFFLRLTTVIDDDLMLAAVAPPRLASPTRFARLRRVDARDHFEQLTVHKTSPYFVASAADETGGDVQTIRDDTDAALAHAEALRAEHEMPRLAGSVSLPGLPSSVLPGDAIDRVAGREASLGTSTARSQGEAPRYPVVAAIQWIQTADGQYTTLQLADRRGEPQRA